MKPYILADFTQDKQEAYGALNQLRIPGFTETNLFDALYDTLDRVDRIEGHKYIILVTHWNRYFQQTESRPDYEEGQSHQDVTIFPISVGWQAREYCESRGMAAPHGMGIPVQPIDYLQADNEMNTFARLTGGRVYFPRFQAEFPEIFQRDRRRHPQPVQHRLPSHQPETRWHLSQAEGRSGRSGRRSA